MPIRYAGVGATRAAGVREMPLGLPALPESVEEVESEVVDEEVEDDRPLEEGVIEEDAIAVVLVLAEGPEVDDESRPVDVDPLPVANLRRLPPSGGTAGGEIESLGP